MNFKRYLLIAVVIVALGVIFLPMLFGDHSTQGTKVIDVTIPPPPPMVEKKPEGPKTTLYDEDNNWSEKTLTEPAQPKAKATPAKPAPNAKPKSKPTSHSTMPTSSHSKASKSTAKHTAPKPAKQTPVVASKAKPVSKTTAKTPTKKAPAKSTATSAKTTAKPPTPKVTATAAKSPPASSTKTLPAPTAKPKTTSGHTVEVVALTTPETATVASTTSSATASGGDLLPPVESLSAPEDGLPPIEQLSAPPPESPKPASTPATTVDYKRHPPKVTASPAAWAVKVGSFTNDENANQLVFKLQQHDFNAFTETNKTKDGIITRVYVGPALIRDKAEAASKRLDKRLHMKGVIVAYEPQATKPSKDT